MTRSNEFLKWVLEVAQGKIVPRNLSVILYDVEGKEFIRWNFSGAYPIKWMGPPCKSDDTATAIETLELAHH
jgi:phage tail-like protein